MSYASLANAIDIAAFRAEKSHVKTPDFLAPRKEPKDFVEIGKERVVFKRMVFMELGKLSRTRMIGA
jgi:hypothetical protein